jgi:hypothetical protein
MLNKVLRISLGGKRDPSEKDFEVLQHWDPHWRLL